MGYQLREEPLTLKEIKAKSADNYVEDIISIPLNTVIDNDLEGLLNILEGELIGDLGVLSDIEYDVVGVGLYDALHIKVTGFVELTEA